jgi:hypothetical protein
MNDLSPIIGQQLSSVEFIQDYLILHFGEQTTGGPSLTFFTWPDVFREEGSYAYGEPEYRNVLCSVLAEDVTAATLEENEAIEIEFESGIILRASLREEDLDVPVAGQFSSGSYPAELWEF